MALLIRKIQDKLRNAVMKGKKKEKRKLRKKVLAIALHIASQLDNFRSRSL